MKARPMGTLWMTLAGWMHRHQQDVIGCVGKKNRILAGKTGTERILLNDSRRTRLARLG